VLRRIIGPKRAEVTGEWRKLLRDLYSSPSIIRIIKSRRMRRAGRVARKGRIGMQLGYGVEARRKETSRKTKT
jgi:hypothetical protein